VQIDWQLIIDRSDLRLNTFFVCLNNSFVSPKRNQYVKYRYVQ